MHHIPVSYYIIMTCNKAKVIVIKGTRADVFRLGTVYICDVDLSTFIEGEIRNIFTFMLIYI